METNSTDDKRLFQLMGGSALVLRICSGVALLSFALGMFLLSLEVWLSDTWAQLSPDEILFHLKASLGGADTTVIRSYCLLYVPSLIVVTVAVYFCHRLTRSQSFGMQCSAIAVTASFGAVMFGVALSNFSQMVDLEAFLSTYANREGSSFIAEHYVNPDDVRVSFPEEKRNLIYIYLESMELTYADEANGGAWDENLIPELTELAREGDVFGGTDDSPNGAVVLPGTEWTVGAMFGQSSGTPLKLPFYGNYVGEEMSDFFPGLLTIGDILENQGYRQCLLIGSDAEFGSRREFFTEHGNYDIYDYVRAQEDGFIDPDYRVFWGFEDQKLFTWARSILPELAASDEPFNFTLLTVDTHFEDGYVCDLCGTEHGPNQYANVISCSSRQVEEFVRWIQMQDFYENTTVVICGDHTTMDSDFCEDVPETYRRRTYTTILNSAVTCKNPEAYRTYSTLDMFPTTLAALGVSIKGDRLGLGTNLYAKKPTILEEYGVNDCVEQLRGMSLFLDQFSASNLGNTMIDGAKKECILSYDDGTLGFGGFLLGDMRLIDPTLIEDAHLVLLDDRTNESTSLLMSIWSSDEEHSDNASMNLAHYYLGAHFEPSEEDLAHIHATAYITINGHEEQIFGNWQLEAAQEYTEAEAPDVINHSERHDEARLV